MFIIKRLFAGRLDRKNFIIALFLSVPIFAIILSMVLVSTKNAAISIFVYVLEQFFLISLFVRRFHDSGKSGWWIVLIPLSGGIALIYLFLKGQQEENKYGSVQPQDIRFMDAVLNKL